jgi:hypothetical protein
VGGSLFWRGATLDEPGRGAAITGAIDLRAVIASDDGAAGSAVADADAGGTLVRDGFGGAFDNTEGRDVSAFGGALDGRHMAGFDGKLAGAAERVVVGGALGVAEGRHTGAFDGELGNTDEAAVVGGAFGVAGGRHVGTFAWGSADAKGAVDFDGEVDGDGACDGVLEAAGGGDDAAFGVALAVGAAPAGTASLVAPFTGTLWDSGTSSQPESIASSSGFARFSVPAEPPSAPFAMSFKVPEPPAAWQLRTAL